MAQRSTDTDRRPNLTERSDRPLPRVSANLESVFMQSPAIVGHSDAIRAAIHRTDRLAQSDCPILICGETGSGKELFARRLHAQSRRAERDFVPLNCAEARDALIRSELFGHERGAFTGAEYRKIGLVESAHRGTLFLDEIAEMRPDAQAQLLRLLEDGHMRRVGSTELIPVDIRFVSATNQPLEHLMDEGRFRSDLYYRIRGSIVRLPPLRSRRGDVPELVQHFVDGHDGAHGTRHHVTSNAIAMLEEHDWPGNVRELAQAMDAALHLAEGPTISASHVAASLETCRPAPLERFDDAMRKRLVKVLMLTGFRLDKAAKLLGVHPVFVLVKFQLELLARQGEGNPGSTFVPM